MTKYQKCISGLMLNRNFPRVPGGKFPRVRRGKVPHVGGGIDIHTLSCMGFSGIEVPRVDYEKLSSDRLGDSSASIRERVQAAREHRAAHKPVEPVGAGISPCPFNEFRARLKLERTIVGLAEDQVADLTAQSLE